MISGFLFFLKKKYVKHRKANPVRVQRKQHASRRRTRIPDRTVHVRPTPYKTSPRASPPKSPDSSLPPVCGLALTTRRRRRVSLEERKAAAAPTPSHLAGPLPDLIDRYVPPVPLPGIDLRASGFDL